MNILFLSTHLNVGGITSYTLTLAKGLKNRGHNVYVAAGSAELLERFNAAGIDYIHIPINTKSEASPKIFFSFFRLRKFIKQKNIDIVHANTRVTQVLAYLISKFCTKPFVSTCHGFFKPRFFRRAFPCWGRKVIAISKEVKDHLVSDFNIPQEQIALIHNGIDADKFLPLAEESRAQLRNKFNVRAGPVVSIVARLSDVKGHIYLIEAFDSVLKKYPQGLLLIAGEGRIKNDLLAQVERLHIENSVIFISSLKDTREIFAVTDVFVMPSLEEGLGLGLMEAMAYGLAVVGSSVGGIKTLIKDEYSGLLVEPRQAQQLAQAILKLLDDPKKRESLGANAREFIRANFTQDRMILETEEVYRNIIDG